MMIVYNIEYNNILKRICDENKTSYMNILFSKKYSYLLDYIIKSTEEFIPNEKFSKKINWILNQYQDFPKCKTCGKSVIGLKQIRYNDEWPKHCCNRCAQLDSEIIAKVKNTKLLLHGSETYNGDYEQIKKNNRLKYGVDWFIQSKEFKEKAKATMLLNGYDHPMHSEDIKNQMSERYFQKYGVKYSIHNPSVIKKARQPYYYDNTYFKSSWELAFYIWLQDNKIIFEYQPEIWFEYSDKNNILHKYLPDFKVNGEYVEIKGDQFINDNGTYKNPYLITEEQDHIYEAKHQCMLKNKVKILSKDEMEKYFAYCKNKFNDNNWRLRFKRCDIFEDLSIPFNSEKMKEEYQYFLTKTLDKFPIGHTKNTIIKYFQQDVFFKTEKNLWNENKNCLRNRLIENRCKYLNKTEKELTVDDILMGFKRSGIHYGYSHFNPLWFKWFIQKYNVRICYDPCGGWGHRLLGGLTLEKYIYNDLSQSTKNNIDRIIEYFKINNVKTFNNDARTFIPDDDFDSMFTCPPYYNLEHYECGDFKDINEFNDFIDSLFDVFHKKESCKIFGMVIREDLLGNHLDYVEKIELKNTDESYLSNNCRKNREFLYIYAK